LALVQRIRENRSTAILFVLVILSLISLASGTHAGVVRDGVRTGVSIVAHPFLKVLKAVEGGTDYVIGLIVSYSAARNEVESLHGDMAKVMHHVYQRHEILQENKRLRRMLDFERNQSRLTLEPVEVIERFEGNVRLIIDRGRRHGIEESMVAVTPDGVVGMVSDVGWITATVLTLNDAESRIGAMISRNRVRGIVRGSGGGVNQAYTMQYIDLKDDVRVGDLVVASPESAFPAGYPIGRVTAVHSEGALLQKTADIESAVNPSTVDEIFILKKAAISYEELAETDGQEPEHERTVFLPEERTLQERYAP